MTKHLRRAAFVSALALTWCLGTTNATADEWNRETILTIDQPMVVPRDIDTRNLHVRTRQ